MLVKLTARHFHSKQILIECEKKITIEEEKAFNIFIIKTTKQTKSILKMPSINRFKKYIKQDDQKIN